jgi:hypothetical protein
MIDTATLNMEDKEELKTDQNDIKEKTNDDELKLDSK